MQPAPHVLGAEIEEEVTLEVSKDVDMLDQEHDVNLLDTCSTIFPADKTFSREGGAEFAFEDAAEQELAGSLSRSPAVSSLQLSPRQIEVASPSPGTRLRTGGGYGSLPPALLPIAYAGSEDVIAWPKTPDSGSAGRRSLNTSPQIGNRLLPAAPVCPWEAGPSPKQSPTLVTRETAGPGQFVFDLTGGTSSSSRPSSRLQSPRLPESGRISPVAEEGSEAGDVACQEEPPAEQLPQLILPAHEEQRLPSHSALDSEALRVPQDGGSRRSSRSAGQETVQFEPQPRHLPVGPATASASTAPLQPAGGGASAAAVPATPRRQPQRPSTVATKACPKKVLKRQAVKKAKLQEEKTSAAADSKALAKAASVADAQRSTKEVAQTANSEGKGCAPQRSGPAGQAKVVVSHREEQTKKKSRPPRTGYPPFDDAALRVGAALDSVDEVLDMLDTEEDRLNGALLADVPYAPIILTRMEPFMLGPESNAIGRFVDQVLPTSCFSTMGSQTGRESGGRASRRKSSLLEQATVVSESDKIRERLLRRVAARAAAEEQRGDLPGDQLRQLGLTLAGLSMPLVGLVVAFVDHVKAWGPWVTAVIGALTLSGALGNQWQRRSAAVRAIARSSSEDPLQDVAFVVNSVNQELRGMVTGLEKAVDSVHAKVTPSLAQVQAAAQTAKEFDAMLAGLMVDLGVDCPGDALLDTTAREALTRELDIAVSRLENLPGRPVWQRPLDGLLEKVQTFGQGLEQSIVVNLKALMEETSTRLWQLLTAVSPRRYRLLVVLPPAAVVCVINVCAAVALVGTDAPDCDEAESATPRRLSQQHLFGARRLVESRSARTGECLNSSRFWPYLAPHAFTIGMFLLLSLIIFNATERSVACRLVNWERRHIEEDLDDIVNERIEREVAVGLEEAVTEVHKVSEHFFQPFRVEVRSLQSHLVHRQQSLCELAGPVKKAYDALRGPMLRSKNPESENKPSSPVVQATAAQAPRRSVSARKSLLRKA
eukprot:TRINITY_DN58156_c0_g1_i1.p1 TRINITY_DN58156_c0_g1~~TRINITY_DN58156_c0_g1_i1.p1  ORF type:complete len:996 (+),score=233.76 TRINITY_DN58156_c0_g1_i1:213-3200(+)